MPELKINGVGIDIPLGHSLVGVVTQTKDGGVYMSENVARAIKGRYGHPRHWTDKLTNYLIIFLYMLCSMILCVYLYILIRGLAS